MFFFYVFWKEVFSQYFVHQISQLISSCADAATEKKTKKPTSLYTNYMQIVLNKFLHKKSNERVFCKIEQMLSVEVTLNILLA